MSRRTPPLKMPWAQLGWIAADTARAPRMDEGPVSILVVAPWCPDCEETAKELEKISARALGRSVWLAGEFATRQETLAFVRRHQLDWPVLLGTSSKDEISRNQARFRQLREAAGDTRRWGVPLWIEGELRNGILKVDRLEWPGGSP